MKKIIIIAISMMMGLAAWTQSLSVDNMTITINQEAYINIQLTDIAGCIASGFYVELPENIMVIDNASTAQGEISSNHIVRMSRLNDSLMRLVVYSADNSVFNFGDSTTLPLTLAYLPVKAGKQTGQFTAKLTGIEFATEANTFLTATDVDFTIVVEGSSGDVNNDGNVNISDVTALIDYLLNGDESSINLINGDCNHDGSINISDVTALIDYLLNDDALLFNLTNTYYDQGGIINIGKVTGRIDSLLRGN